MAFTKITYLICYDDHRSFTEDIRKRFNDPSKYKVESFHSLDEFADHIMKIADNKSCKVALIGVPDNMEHYEAIGKLIYEISKPDPDTGIILIAAPEKMEEVKKIIEFNIDAYIPGNANAILRIHNAVKKLISEYNIDVYRKRRNTWLYILGIFLIICIFLVVIAYFKLPIYF